MLGPPGVETPGASHTVNKGWTEGMVDVVVGATALLCIEVHAQMFLIAFTRVKPASTEGMDRSSDTKTLHRLDKVERC